MPPLLKARKRTVDNGDIAWKTKEINEKTVRLTECDESSTSLEIQEGRIEIVMEWHEHEAVGKDKVEQRLTRRVL
jgi:hypothetical protein